MIPDRPDDWNADEATAAEQVAALGPCTCWDPATMEHDPAGPCARCIADEDAA